VTPIKYTRVIDNKCRIVYLVFARSELQTNS